MKKLSEPKTSSYVWKILGKAEVGKIRREGASRFFVERCSLQGAENVGYWGE